MPTLHGVVDRFSHAFTRTPGGQMVRGVVKPPPDPRLSYTGQLPPRFVMTATQESGVKAGMLIKDQGGARFLVGRWVDDYFGQRLVATQYVLFAVNSDLAWTRATTILEPISGLRTVTGDQSLGTIACLSEVVQHKSETTGVPYDLVRIICNQNLLLDDRVDKKRVIRVYQDLGLTYAEAI